MKILFINSCLRRNYSMKILPVGLASVMTYVHEQGYRFDLLDLDITDYDDDYVEKFIRDNPYDVYLYGTIVTHYKWVKWLTHTIRNYQPQAKIVVGNSVAGSCYDVFMDNAPADAVVVGEGEFTTKELLDCFLNKGDLGKVEGIAYRDSEGHIIKTPTRKACDINELPMTNWEFFDIQKYMDRNDGTNFGNLEEGKPRTFPVSTARGCSFRCTFCHFVFWDDPYRYRKPEKVVAEIRRNVEKYGANYINFFDDLTFASLPQTERLVDAILDSGMKFGWSAAIRTDLFGDPKHSRDKRFRVARKMKESGCRALGYSLESGNSEILEMMEKHVNVEFFEEQVKLLKEAGLISYTSVVFGYPIETPETIQQTFEMCLKNKLYPSIGFLLPLPYTGMYEYAKKHGHIVDDDAYLTSITERQDICLNMTQMTDDEIMAEIKTGASELNKLLELGLDENRFIRQGGVKQRMGVKKQLEDSLVAAANLERNENDVSFNYSQAVFDEDRD